VYSPPSVFPLGVEPTPVLFCAFLHFRRSKPTTPHYNVLGIKDWNRFFRSCVGQSFLQLPGLRDFHDVYFSFIYFWLSDLTVFKILVRFAVLKAGSFFFCLNFPPDPPPDRRLPIFFHLTQRLFFWVSNLASPLAPSLLFLSSHLRPNVRGISNTPKVRLYSLTIFQCPSKKGKVTAGVPLHTHCPLPRKNHD